MTNTRFDAKLRAAERIHKSERHVALDGWMDEPWTLPHMSEHLTYPSCLAGPCKGGTRPCPAPSACRIPEQAEPTAWGVLKELLCFWRWK